MTTKVSWRKIKKALEQEREEVYKAYYRIDCKECKTKTVLDRLRYMNEMYAADSQWRCPVCGTRDLRSFDQDYWEQQMEKLQDIERRLDICKINGLGDER